jgi:filamentous hemagglutinin
VQRPDGTQAIFEVKTGDAANTARQKQVFPLILSGDAVPSGRLAGQLGLKPGIALKNQGLPEGIPIYQITAPGL